MITKVEIMNFRNLRHIVLEFKERISILTGANGIGKSNTLNGMSYCLTNTLLTDKWGVGENDLDSIFPVDYVKGQEPTVEITLETGVKFKKVFAKGKDGNTTEFYVNGIKEKTKKGFEEKLYEALNFKKKLRCEKEVNELRLFTDPLYPLQKLDPKALRTLLVELGCSVTNEEVYAAHPEYEPLKQFEAKFMGDYTNMRVAWKRDKAELNKQLDAIPSMMENYAGEDFKPEIRKGLEEQKQEVINKINALNSNSKEATADLKKELEETKHQKELYVAEESSKIMTELAKLEEQKKQAVIDANSSQNEELKAINSKIQNKSEEMSALNETMKSYSTTRTNCRNEARQAQTDVDNLYKLIENLHEELEKVTNRQFVGYVTCPDCGKVFVADEAALVLFNKQKQDDLARIQDNISNNEIEIKKKEKIFNETYHKGYEAKVKEEELEKRIFYIKDEIDELNVQKSNIASKPIDNSKVTDLELKINTLKATQIDTTKFNSKIEELTLKIQKLSTDNSSEKEEEISKLSSLKEDIEAKIKEQYEIEAKQNGRIKTLEKQDDIVFALNDVEHQLELVNGFIHTKISLINNKAKALTGLDFVMLEENISNDGVKEVCYPTINGVEFANVNTSEKIAVGIQFIHKLKEILGANDLPILADRLEGFDDIQKIKNLTTEQMICTVVGNSEQKEIVII